MTKFSDLKLDPKVLKAIDEAGYENPTPIQAGAIPHALEGRDVLGIAQTGTGKTASFTLPMITLLGRGRARARMPRSLVLCPTRELAAQVAENFDTYAKHTKLTKALLIGGVSFGEQDKLIDRGVDVLIATPGRLLDHFERGKLLLTGVQIMVVDEADRMLDMGFIPDIERIFQLTPFTRQTLFFSATMAPEIERITNTFLHSPERIEVARQATASETITQKLIEIRPARRDQSAKQKRELLRALINAEGDALKNAIIFCNRKTEVDIVAKSLKKHGFDAAPIHGDLDQSQRTRTLEGFREGTLKLLIASDVAARGLDIPAVSHVFNFDLPSHAEDYVHRIGRTGRAGRQGTAFSLSTPSDEKYLQAIESLLKQALPRADLPEGFSPSEGGGDRSDDRGDGRRGRGGRDERRGRGRGGRREDRAENETQDARQEKAEQPAAPQPAREEAGESGRDEGERRDDRESGRDEGRGNRDRGERGQDRRERGERDRGRGGRDRRDGGRDNGRDGGRERVVGMGDHVPEFMRASFRPSTVTGADEDEATQDAGSSADVKVEDKPKQDESKPARGRGRRKAKADAAAAEDAPVENAEKAVDDKAAAEAAAATVEPAAPEAEAKPKPRRARRKKADDAAEGEAKPAKNAAAASEQAPSPKPRRARRKKADDATAQPDASEAAERAAKPRRTRKKADEEAAAQPGASETPEPAAKPRRTRRKKADADAPAES